MDINLTPYQRINLFNQYTILQKLALIQGDEYDAEDYELKAKIVSNGYAHEYYMIADCISEEFSEEEAKLVWDTLEMYSAIYFSYDRIQNPQLTSEQILFAGFDGNYETNHMFYCRFVLFEMKRYGEISGDGRNDFNSHCEKCSKYRSMLCKWEEMGKPYQMSEEQIRELIETY